MFNRTAYMKIYNKKAHQKPSWKQYLKEYEGRLRRKSYRVAYRKLRHLLAKRTRNQVKRFIGCQLCGYKHNLSKLHFHHVRKLEKVFNIGEGSKWEAWAYFPKNFISEVNKCILLCSWCHKKLHTKEKLNGRK